MLTIRLQRVGKRNRAQYRVVLTDHRKPATSGYQEILGTLDPHTKEVKLKEDRIKYWLEQGVQLSQTARDMLVRKGLVEKKELKFTSKNPKTKKTADSPERKDADKDDSAPAKEKAKPEEKKEDK